MRKRPRNQPKARIVSLPANEQGRDLVVGDLHGHRPTLDAALEALSFDPAADRLLSVGDLVDRGPDSVACLRLLREPWFHAVKGNHEDLLLGSVRELDGAAGTQDPRFALHQNNGGEWLIHLWPPDDEFRTLIEQVRELPHVLVVGQGNHRYHVVHAGFADGMTDETIDRNQAGDPESLIWSRQRGKALQRLQTAGKSAHAPSALSLTYCGHVVGADDAGRPARGHGHVNLETGVAHGLYLSIAVRRPDGTETIHQQAPVSR
ncbi:metallophosphoesterase [Aquisalimonas lutea]|uniref:metallophosphoesterase n=1 Tax=Aquisalimonas lutea TaxID=1327750 RepID=UPI0025B34BCB|nr:metallophosphoesterase [Aquisalimonas lutea]MDN3517164.1 metallophosphoesterase [Aquisalimonas lutea]